MDHTWYWKLGFAANPFSIKPGALNNHVIAHKVERVIERIEQGNIQFIESPLGTGKTTMLKSIVAKFGGKGKIVYASCIRNEPLNLEMLLKNATFAGRLLGKLPKEVILLVDEAQNISRDDTNEIAQFISSGSIKAIAFFGLHYNKKAFPDEINNAMNGNVAVLSYLSPEQAVELVRSRVGNLKLLPDYVIRELYGRTNGNPRRLLQHCEDICRKATELSIRELTITDVSTLLKSPHLTKAEKKPAKGKLRKATAAKKPAKKGAQKKKEKKQHKKSDKSGNYNLQNIRTYEQELSTIRKNE